VATDREIFERMVDEHGAATLALLRRLCGNLHDAEDVFQDVAVRVWRHLHTRPRLRNPRAWLMTIAYRAFLDHQDRRPAHHPLLDADAPAYDRREENPAALAEHAERCRLLGDAVCELSPPLRSVIALHYTGGLTIREIAHAMAISSGTVKSRLNAGLEKLRRIMT
jgi:RNA polymerase sigma-70 factor (ECF subfamily)